MANFIKIGRTIAEIWRFNSFLNGGRLPSRISKIHFLWLGRLRVPFCTSVPNFVKISQTIAEILQFLRFSRGRQQHLGFSKQDMPSCQISSKLAELLQRYGNSKWRPSATLDLLGAYLDHQRRLLGGLHHCAKFGWNRSNTFDTLAV